MRRRTTTLPNDKVRPAAPSAHLWLPPVVRTTLRRVGARFLRVRMAEGALRLGAALPALFLGQALADRVFNLPWPVRALLLAGDAAVAGWIGWKFFVLPWQRRLTARTAALLVEREAPEFRSGLISAVELTGRQSDRSDRSAALVTALLAQVSARVRQGDLPRRVVKTTHLRPHWRAAALALVLAGGLAAAFPRQAAVLGRRIALQNVPLPTQTTVVPITRNESALVGADVVLSARAEGAVPPGGRVFIVYANHERAEFPVVPTADDARVFALTLKNVQQAFTYHFALNDGVGEDYRVAPVVPPVLETCRFVQRYPAYTGLEPGEPTAGNLALLAGSQMQVEGRSTQPLRSVSLRLEGLKQSVAATVGADGRSFRGEFTVPRASLTGFYVKLVNREGVGSNENTFYRVQLVEDKRPAVELTQPRSARLAVVLGSTPTLAFGARDDFGLERLALRYEVEPPVPPSGEPLPPQAGELPLPLPPRATTSRQSLVWDLSKLTPALTVGSTVRFWIEATDNNNVTGPGIGQSPKHTLAVLSETDMQAELTDLLGQQAKEIDGVYQTQKRLNENVDAAIRSPQP